MKVQFKPVQFSDCAPQIIETWKLKKTWNEWHGPCPNCGGEDRFWIYCIPSDILAMTCRGCGGRGQNGHLYRLARQQGLLGAESTSKQKSATFRQTKFKPLSNEDRVYMRLWMSIYETEKAKDHD